MFTSTTLAGMTALLLCSQATAQKTAPAGTPHPYLMKLAQQQLSARKDLISAIRTREQFEARRAEVRKQLVKMIGGFPGERSPLNVRKVGVLDRGDYRIEKIIYESQPRFYVTANLYVPQTGQPPYPAVLQPVGHSQSAKSRAFYQTLGLGLVKNGFVVLTYDPIGQGERTIYYDAALGGSRVGGPTAEHEMAGIQSLLGGQSIAHYMVWDGMRSLDVLQSLTYVDPKRLGVSGCSGGGTMTAYLAALDERVQVAAPSCYITDWEDQLAGTGPQDAEQQFPDQLKNGLNHADLVEAFAPKPYLIASTTEDFFPIAGSRKAFEESQRIYSLFDAKVKIATSYDGGPHGTTQKQREAIYAWMNRWLNGGSGEIVPESTFQTEHEEDMLCTTTGQVATSLGGETPSTWNMRRLSKLTPPRPLLSGNPELDALRANLKREIPRLTRYEASHRPLAVKTGKQTERKGYRLTQLSYETVAGRTVGAMLAEPSGALPKRGAVLLVGEALIDEIDELAELGYTVLTMDQTSNPKTTWLALMVGKTMVGMRIDDILRGIDLLSEKGLLIGGKCLGYGKGFAAAELLHAAVMDERISELVIDGGLLSYASIGRTPIHRQIFDSVIPGVLGHYDLPDLVAALAPRPVTLLGLRSPLGNQVFKREVRAEYKYAEAAYTAAGASAKLKVAIRREAEGVATVLQAPSTEIR